MGMSIVLSAVSLGWAAYEFQQFQSWQYSAGIAYWGVMEALQALQHVYAARPEDNYAMCGDPMNRQLTDLGAIHIIFQPLFVCFVCMSMYRRHSMEARIEADLIQKLCLCMGLWYLSYSLVCKLMGSELELMPPATEDCPNYMWLYEGYDGFLKQSSPNKPGQACTFYAPTRSGHLAW
jgi:hypothetical protein